MKKANIMQTMKNRKQYIKPVIGGICIIAMMTSTIGCGSKSQSKAKKNELDITTTSTEKSTTKKSSQKQTAKETTKNTTTSPTQTTTSPETEPSVTDQPIDSSNVLEDIPSEIIVEQPTTAAPVVETPAPTAMNSLEETSTDPYQQHIALIRNAYQTNDISALGEWDQLAFPMIKRCLDGAYKYTSSADREKYVHDWICNNTVYDIENYAKGTIPYISYTFNGVFEKGVAVCDGYTAAFVLIMNVMGIPAEAQLGTVRGEGHSWAIVKLDDGEWYNVDVTFDDGNNIEYDYFNITTAQLQATRSFTPKRQCNGTKYSYIHYFMPDYDHMITSPKEYQTFVTNMLKKKETSSYVYITEDLASQCIANYKYTYDTYALTGIGATIYCLGNGSSLLDGNEKYYKRELSVEYPKNFFVISSNEQLFDIARNELLNGNTEICYITTSGYNIDQGIKYISSRSDDIWQHVATKSEYYNSHVIVLN